MKPLFIVFLAALGAAAADIPAPITTRAQLHAALLAARDSLSDTVVAQSTEAFVKQQERTMDEEMARDDITKLNFTLRSDGLWTINVQFEPTARMLAVIARPELAGKLTAQEQRTLAAARELCRTATAGAATPAAKARALHDALIERAHYNTSCGMEPWDVLLPPYGGVCLAYARAYQLLLTLAGVPNRLVVGWANEDHAWNLVQLGGVWYHVDCTWDDPVTRGSNRQTLTHDYFLRTDAQMGRTHRWVHTDYPAADIEYRDTTRRAR